MKYSNLSFVLFNNFNNARNQFNDIIKRNQIGLKSFQVLMAQKTKLIPEYLSEHEQFYQMNYPTLNNTHTYPPFHTSILYDSLDSFVVGLWSSALCWLAAVCLGCFVTYFDRKRYRTLIATKNSRLDNLPGVILTFCCCISVSNQTLFALLQISIKIKCRWGIWACVSLCSMFRLLSRCSRSRCLFCAKTQIESKLGRWIWTELFIPTFHLSSSGI